MEILKQTFDQTISEQGNISIVDRKKDMIMVSGFNVFPNEIEDVVMSHPKVGVCTCIGGPDENSGKALILFVEKAYDSLTLQELKDYCRKNLTGCKQPQHVVFKDELPVSAVGKVLRKDLRDMAV